jgi:hypothetical protein
MANKKSEIKAMEPQAAITELTSGLCARAIELAIGAYGVQWVLRRAAENFENSDNYVSQTRYQLLWSLASLIEESGVHDEIPF